MLEKIKLIIWDLDETLWKGTFSEGIINFPEENKVFLRQCLDAGIVHSICSKNDYLQIQTKLEELGIWNCFIFPSIDWSPKGQRVKKIIEDVQLRPENVLFIDDNPQNLQEAEFYCKNIQLLNAGKLHSLLDEGYDLVAKDLKHARLKQYRILEEKSKKKTNYSSNEDFLYSCHIKLSLHSDCLAQAERLHDLVLRSNQLNYTKERPNYEDFVNQIKDSKTTCGYIRVRDDYGDYGVVGFYAIKEGKLIHFLFSCRTLGMQIEQYVYNILGCPELKVQGEVVVKLKNNIPSPGWIQTISDEVNNDDKVIIEKSKKSKSKILIIGPCDMDQMFNFLQNGQEVVTEFVYVGTKAPRVENHTHIAQLVTAIVASQKRKEEICEDSPWFDPKMLETHLSSESFDCVIISTLPVGNSGVYRRKKTGELISFGVNYYDLTDPRNFDDFIHKRIFTNTLTMTIEELIDFKTKYEKVDFLTEEYICNNLNIINKSIGNACLILILGTEIEYKRETEKEYIGRHLVHKHVNDIIRKWASNKQNVKLLSFDNYIHSQDDFTNRINHYVKRVYFELARDIVKILNNNKKTNVKTISLLQFYFDRIIEIPFVSRFIRRLYRKVINPVKKIFSN